MMVVPMVADVTSVDGLGVGPCRNNAGAEPERGEVPGRGMARRIGFLARKISSNVIFAKGESAAT